MSGRTRLLTVVYSGQKRFTGQKIILTPLWVVEYKDVLFRWCTSNLFFITANIVLFQCINLLSVTNCFRHPFKHCTTWIYKEYKYINDNFRMVTIHIAKEICIS